MFEKMKLHETEHSKYLHAYGNQSFNHSNIRPRPCSNQQLIDQQIRAVQFSRLKQEQFLKPKNTAYRESEAQIPQQIHPKEQIQKKGNGRSLPLSSWKAHQPGSGMRAVFLGSRSGSCGTGVFLPRGTSSPSDSRKKPGKGCSTVLIPARVVQALQLHFEQMAKAGGLPPLNDVLVSNNDGMYSLQKQESRKEPQPANIHKDMMLPPEWTY
ncbi:uncharacterized protein G2W53_037576 [Senna tora]|uniref:Uncharacterized protein n=1 Tax=Senna tora TaxID=362788 RepID=A0A834W1C0_9FABA|nr:uncharacterized protein G2W53_037576 [Senna tora]